MPGRRKKERREHTRHLLKGSLPILWEDEDGEEHIARAECIDVSTHGLRVRLPNRPPWRAPVIFNHHDLRIAGRGVVRFSVPKKGSFDAGIECPNGTGWCEPSEAPGPDPR